MKPHLILTILLLQYFSFSVTAQTVENKIYVKLYGGYGLFSSGSFKGVSQPLISDTNFFKVSKKGLGAGLRFGGGVGFRLKKYLSIGVDVEYLEGKTLTEKVKQDFTTITFTSQTDINHSMLSIIPNVKFETVTDSRFNFYNRLGLIIGIPLDLTQDFISEYSNSVNGDPRVVTLTYHAEYDLKNGLGFQAAIGVQAMLTDNIQAFAELSGYSLSFKRVKYEETERYRKDVQYISGSDPLLMGEDNSRNIIYYKDQGSNQVDTTGTVENYLFQRTHTRDDINVNAITVNVGINFRF